MKTAPLKGGAFAWAIYGGIYICCHKSPMHPKRNSLILRSQAGIHFQLKLAGVRNDSAIDDIPPLRFVIHNFGNAGFQHAVFLPGGGAIIHIQQCFDFIIKLGDGHILRFRLPVGFGHLLIEGGQALLEGDVPGGEKLFGIKAPFQQIV